jgi:mono/diheme cytochrome c family protein
MKRYGGSLAIGAAALIVTVPGFDVVQAQQVGSPRVGLDIARNICSSCHAIRPAELKSPNSGAPSFEQIAAVPGINAIALKVALRTSHETMPNLILSEAETNDVITYILSLGDR